MLPHGLSTPRPVCRPHKSLTEVLPNVHKCHPPHRPVQSSNRMEAKMKMLTERQAYAAMYYFLDQLYQSTKSDDIGGLLGSMSLLPDGEPADSAITQEWEEAVQFAL